jgi:hypothetical protein
MATVKEILSVLGDVLNEYPTCLICASPEKRPEDIMYWIEDVFACSGGEEVILRARESEEENTEKSVLSVSDLNGKMLRFSDRETELIVEVSCEGPDDEWRFDIPIVGAQLQKEDGRLVFLLWDRER